MATRRASSCASQPRWYGSHDKLEGAPLTAANVSGEGWSFVLSTLKSFLETGTGLTS